MIKILSDIRVFLPASALLRPTTIKLLISMSIKTLIIQIMLFISSSTSLLYLNENLSSDAEAGSWAEVEAWAEAEAGEETPAVSWNLLDSLNT